MATQTLAASPEAAAPVRRKRGGSILLQPRIAVPAALLAAYILILVAGLLLWTVPPNAQDLSATLQPPLFLGGEAAHPLGTDQLGRDILARLLVGGQNCLLLAIVAVIGSAVIGITTGVAAGYLGGIIDMVVMRIADIQLALPSFLLALTLLAVLPPGIGSLLIVMILSGWVLFARVVRGQILRLREATFIEASRGLGASFWWIVRHHLLPNTAGTIVVIGTILLGQLLILQSGLSFLGLGLAPPAASWGASLSEGVGFLADAWWLATLPGLALMIVTLLVNILGDALRDALNPALRTGRG